jgi:hypothetical protein
MGKAKLTLYIDEKTNKRIHQTAGMLGKSISSIVKEYFIEKEKEIKSIKISPSLSRWIGILDTKKAYQELRDEEIEAKIKKYESSD